MRFPVWPVPVRPSSARPSPRRTRADAFITLKGVDPVLEGQVTDIERTMTKGSLSGLATQSEDDRPGILLGHDLAQQLGAEVGDEITLITPGGSLSPMGLMPRNRRVRVAGVFQLGLYEYDSAYGFVNLEFAKRLFSKEAPDLIQLRVERHLGCGRHRRSRSRSVSALSTSAKTGPS